jgi:hypothetical protein
MAGRHARRGNAIGRLVWLLPLAFVVHECEELLTMPGWMAAHPGLIEGLLQRLGITAHAPVGLGTGAIAAAMLVLLLLFVAVTAAASSPALRGAAIYPYCLLLGGFLVHGFGHLGQAVLLGFYVPGLVTALLVVIPASLYLYACLLASRAIGKKQAAALTLGGAVLFVPGILLAISIGLRVAR